MSKIEVNQISSQCGSTLTIGQSGDSIQLACGATQTGFGRTGTVNWDTTAKTASFTAVSGNGYFVNTTSGAITVTLPASPSAGDIVAIKDYANTADTNAISIARNGSNIDGTATDGTIANEGGSITLVYVDATKGWLVTDAAQKSDVGFPSYITATGGTVTCCGDYKIHTFTGPGTFCVSCAGNACGSNTVEYIVTAGGGGGGAYVPSEPGAGAGGGAGGFRFASSSLAPLCYPAKPLAGSNLPVTAQGYPITVGGGGAGQSGPGDIDSDNGSNSVFSTITSTGGGGTVNDGAPQDGRGKPGGSGGGAGGTGFPGPVAIGGSGNTPPVSPPQGNDGGSYTGAGAPYYATAGGGGATAAGESLPDHNRQTGGAGGAGAGLPNAFGTSGENCGSFYYFSGGGGGGVYSSPSTGIGGSGGVGGGGNASTGPTGCAGTANTGGGGGGQGGQNGTGGAGGSGIVIIRYKYQN
jgi:hypothetical protein